MATIGKFLGEKIGVTIDGDPIAEVVSHTWDTSVATSQSSSKDSEGHHEYLPSWSDGTMSFDAMVIYSNPADTLNFWDLYQNGILAKTIFTLVLGTTESGDSVVTQDAILTGLSKNATAGETASFNGSFQFTGKPTISQNPAG